MFMRSLMAFSLVKYLFLLSHLFSFFICRTFPCIKALQFLAVARCLSGPSLAGGQEGFGVPRASRQEARHPFGFEQLFKSHQGDFQSCCHTEGGPWGFVSFNPDPKGWMKMKRRPRPPQPPLWGTNKPTTHAGCALLLWHIRARTSLPVHLSLPGRATRCWKSSAEDWQSSLSDSTDICQLFMHCLNQGGYCRHRTVHCRAHSLCV